MQDLDFEKQVQQKMVEMKLSPSEAVWEGVDMRLHRKERTRRWIVWVPLIMAGLSLLGYWAWDNLRSADPKESQSIAGATGDRQPNDRKPGITNEKTSDQKAPNVLEEKPGKIAAGEIAAKGSDDKIITQQTHEVKDKKQKNQNLPIKSITPNTASATPLDNLSTDTTSKNKIPVPSPAGISKDLIQKELFQPGNNAKENSSDLGAKNADSETELYRAKELNAVSVHGFVNPGSAINTSLIPLANSTGVQATIKKLQVYKGWSWGLSFQGGQSSLKEGGVTLNKIFGGGGQMDFLNSAPSSGNSGQPSNVTYQERYPLRAASGFSAGAYLRKNLSRRFSLSVGVNYTLYRTTKIIGVKVDSLILLQSSFFAASQQAYRQYYRLGNTDSYSNNYHFVEVPVLLQTRLTGRRTLPVYWDLGFSLSKLFSSNALHFDSNSGVYYKDDNLFKKTQINFQTGLPVRIFAANKLALQAGPEFKYGLTNIFAKSVNNEQHFLFFGLKANLQIGKK